MKKFVTIAALSLFAVFVIADLAHHFLSDDPIGYFKQDPRRLLYVAGLAVAGGLLMLGYSKLDAHAQRAVRILGFTLAASAATFASVYFAFVVFSLLSTIAHHGGSVWPTFRMCVPVVLVFPAAAAAFWIAAWRGWKSQIPRCQ